MSINVDDNDVIARTTTQLMKHNARLHKDILDAIGYVEYAGNMIGYYEDVNGYARFVAVPIDSQDATCNFEESCDADEINSDPDTYEVVMEMFATRIHGECM